ncbi:hypothetical protein TNCV_4820401 [Trichonephila clavipes]|nr:hypothetical protein TNCV_4820401 [Trichonephila clavipes]
MVWVAIGPTSRSPLVPINGTLNSARYISGCRSSLIRKKFGAGALACSFTRSLANRKRLIHGCRTTGSSPYASHYS